jgi:hypothetical protein
LEFLAGKPSDSCRISVGLHFKPWTYLVSIYVAQTCAAPDLKNANLSGASLRKGDLTVTGRPGETTFRIMLPTGQAGDDK